MTVMSGGNRFMIMWNLEFVNARIKYEHLIPKSRYRNAKNEVSPDCIMVCDQTDPHPMGETTRTYEDTTIPD